MTPDRPSPDLTATEDFARYRDRGDAEALGRVFDATALRLTVLAGHLCRDAQAAEDLVQSTFLVAMRDAAAFDGVRPVERWLAGILRHRALDLTRRRRRDDAASEDALAGATDGARDPFDAAADAELFELVSTAIDRVDGPSRQVLALRLVHGLEPTAIAHALGRKPSTVRMQLKRGLELLRTLVPAAGALLATIVVEGRGLAAVRTHLLDAAATTAAASSSAAATGVSTTPTWIAPNLSKVTGALVVKHWIAIAVVTFIVLAIGSLAWTPDRRDDVLEHGSLEAHGAERASDAASATRLAEAAASPSARAERVVRATAERAPTTAPAALDVDVVWAASGAPAADVGVYLRPEHGGVGRSARTDARGRVRFDALDPCAQTLVFAASAERRRVDPRTDRALRVELPAGVTAAGLVVDIEGLPVEGAAICRVDGLHHRVMHELGYSGADGRFRIEHVDPQAQLVARKSGWQPSPIEDADDEVEFVLGAKGHRLFGRVLDANGAPVPFARLAVGVDEDARELLRGSDLAPGEQEGGKKSMDLEGILLTADEHGRFESDEIPGGYVLLVARPVETATGLVGATNGYLHFGSELELDVHLDEGATLRGRVTDARGRPIAGATIATEWEGRTEFGQFEAELGAYVSDASTTTDADGHYRLSGLLPGQHDFEAKIDDFFLARLDADVADGEHCEWSPVVANSGSVTVRLVDAAGSPLADWFAVLRGTDEPVRAWYQNTARTDADGRATLHGLAPNTPIDVALHAPTISAFASGLPQAVRTGFTPSDEVHTIVIAADERPTASIIGRWPDSAFDPTLVLLRLERADWAESVVVAVRQDRAFVFDQLGAGSYRLVTAGGAFPSEIELTTVDIGVGETLELGELRPPHLPQVAIELVDASGAPVADAHLALAREGHAVDVVFEGRAGRYVCSPLQPGTYEVTVDARGAAPGRFALEVASEPFQEQVFELARGVRVPLRVQPYTTRVGSPTEVYLAVHDAEDGSLVLQRAVTGDGAGLELPIDLILEPGRYDLRLRDRSPARRGTFHASVEVIAGGTVEPVVATLDR